MTNPLGRLRGRLCLPHLGLFIFLNSALLKSSRAQRMVLPFNGGWQHISLNFRGSTCTLVSPIYPAHEYCNTRNQLRLFFSGTYLRTITFLFRGNFLMSWAALLPINLAPSNTSRSLPFLFNTRTIFILKYLLRKMRGNLRADLPKDARKLL